MEHGVQQSPQSVQPPSRSGFVGKFKHTLDSKRRITIPSEWRGKLGSPQELYVMPDVSQNCLCVLTGPEMDRRIERMRDLALGDSKAREFLRVLGSESNLVTWDAQGRMRVKDELLQRVGIVDAVLIVGTFDRFELWNPESFEKAILTHASIKEAAQGMKI
jgi:MraZ protein